MSEQSTHAFLCGLFLGLIIGALATLCVHNTAIREHQFRKYKQSHTNNITFSEWLELKK